MNPEKRKLRSAEELERASLALQYEMATLGTTHALLQESVVHGDSPCRERALSNALLHSFLLASRNLLSFLYSHKPRPSDIIAEDFFSDPELWRKQRLIAEPAMANGELIGMISRRLAHLTWERADTTKPAWGAFRIAWNIALAMESFLVLADRKGAHPGLREEVDTILALLKADLGDVGCVNTVMAPLKEILVL